MEKWRNGEMEKWRNGEMEKDDTLITERYKVLEGILDERQRRLYAAAEAKVLGHGGVKRVWNATGVARGSILAGLKELLLTSRWFAV